MSHWHYWRWRRSRSTPPGPCTRPGRRTWGWGKRGRSKPGGWWPGPAAARPGWTRPAPPSTCSRSRSGSRQHLERHWPEPGAAWLGGVREDGLETGEGGVGHTDDGPGDEGEEIHGDGVRDGAHEGEIHTLSKQETPSDQQYQISELGAGGAHLILLCFLTGRTSLTSMTAWPLQTSPARAIMQNSGSADNFYRKL